MQALQLIREHKLVLGDLSTTPCIDLTIDGADEITADLDCIKGGGGCHVQEKIVAFNSTHFVVICDASKFADNLGQNWRKGIPVEIIPLAAEPVARKMRELGGASAASPLAMVSHFYLWGFFLLLLCCSCVNVTRGRLCGEQATLATR